MKIDLLLILSHFSGFDYNQRRNFSLQALKIVRVVCGFLLYLQRDFHRIDACLCFTVLLLRGRAPWSH